MLRLATPFSPSQSKKANITRREAWRANEGSCSQSNSSRPVIGASPSVDSALLVGGDITCNPITHALVNKNSVVADEVGVLLYQLLVVKKRCIVKKAGFGEACLGVGIGEFLTFAF